MNASEKKAREVCEHLTASLSVDRVKAFDPMMIFAIISIIIEFYKLMKYWCNMTEDEAIEALSNPGVLGRAMLRRVTNKVVGVHFKERKDLASLSGKIRKALLAVASNVTKEDSAAIFAEVQSV